MTRQARCKTTRPQRVWESFIFMAFSEESCAFNSSSLPVHVRSRLLSYRSVGNWVGALRFVMELRQSLLVRFAPLRRPMGGQSLALRTRRGLEWDGTMKNVSLRIRLTTAAGMNCISRARIANLKRRGRQ